MNTLGVNRAPQPQESLAAYIRRVRMALSLNQRELAEGAGIHLQSIGKLERGKTSKLNRKNLPDYFWKTTPHIHTNFLNLFSHVLREPL